MYSRSRQYTEVRGYILIPAVVLPGKGTGDRVGWRKEKYYP
jgi:hypothetical protein